MGSVRFVTFGCKANQYDTQVLREALVRHGWRETEGDEELVVLNTCTVTAEAGRKARQLTRRLVRENPRRKICITGCLAESEAEQLREIPGVHWVLTGDEAKKPIDFLRGLGQEIDPAELGVPAGISEFHGHTRAFLKIQDGCDMSCSFCIIPSVRGPSRSRPAAELALEVRRLVAAGHVEIVLCGIHIGHWGREWGGELTDLLRELASIRDLEFRLRLSSIEATEVTAALLGVLADYPDRIAPHLHLPLQSGDDSVLERMNRWYCAADYLKSVERIRERLDEPALSADVIVGFPGENDAHFQNTAGIVKSAGFARLHVFPFSARPGTAAADLGGVPEPGVVKERRAHLAELARRQGDAFRRRLDGRHETVTPEGWVGLAGRYQRVRLIPEDWPGGAPALAGVVLGIEPSPDSRGETKNDGEVRLVGRPRREARPTNRGRSAKKCSAISPEEQTR